MKATTAIARTQKSNAANISNKRGMARRAKTQGAKRVRQLTKKELNGQ